MHSWLLGVVETVQLIVVQFFTWSFPVGFGKGSVFVKILVKGTKPPWPIRVCGNCVCVRVLLVFEFFQYSSSFGNDGNISVTRRVCY